MSDEDVVHSMCVSLRIDPTTLKELDEVRQEVTLSAMMNMRIKNTLDSLVKCAKKGENGD